MGKCKKFELYGKKCDTTVNFSGSLGSFSSTLRLRLVKNMFVNFYVDGTTITITAGSTSTIFTITTAVTCPYEVGHSVSYPFIYNALNGTAPENPYTGYAYFSGNSLILSFPRFPADTTSISFNGVFGSYTVC